MSETISDQYPLQKGRMVVRCKMKIHANNDDINEMIENGIGVLDYGTGDSLRAEDAKEEDQDGASRSFKTYREFTRRGGYGVLVPEGTERMCVGRVTPPCGMFLPFVNPDGNKESLKAFQLDEFAVVDKDEFGELYESMRNRDLHPALSPVGSGNGNKGPGRESVVDAFHQLERRGSLKYSTW